MLELHMKEDSVPTNESGVERPWIVEMRKHCEGCMQKAESRRTASTPRSRSPRGSPRARRPS